MATKREKALIRRAIEDIMAEDGDFARAIHDLCGIVGLEYPAYRASRNVRPVSVAELTELIADAKRDLAVLRGEGSVVGFIGEPPEPTEEH